MVVLNLITNPFVKKKNYVPSKLILYIFFFRLFLHISFLFGE